MYHWLKSRSFLILTAIFAVLLAPAMAKSSSAKTKKEPSKPQLRIVCATALAEEQNVILATRDKEGKWLELSATDLRASFITDWLPAATGELHLVVREENELKSICQFQYPEETKNALVMLISNEEKTKYEAKVVDPKKIEFGLGSMLILNFSTHTGVVQLGADTHTIEAGQQVITKPVVEENGMYKLQVFYVAANGEKQLRSDRRGSGKPDARSILLLIPDKELSLRGMSIPLFGALE